jgi:RNA polymerase sigma-70 factor (ECF subfamily)
MQAVIQRILEGDHNAFRKIVQQYSAELLSFAERMLGDHENAQDATQTTFIKLFANLHRYKQDHPFRPWLFKIHLNTCRTHYRKLKRHHTDSLDYPLGDSNAGREVTEGPNLELIQACIDRLSWKQSTAFQLVEIEGFNAEEAGMTMQCATATVRVHLMRAKRNLQSMLKEAGYVSI